jgi:hypothetical protein
MARDLLVFYREGGDPLPIAKFINAQMVSEIRGQIVQSEKTKKPQKRTSWYIFKTIKRRRAIKFFERKKKIIL